MLQEVSKDNEQSYNNLPQRERTKQRSWEVLQDNQLAEVYVSHRKSPTLKILRCQIPGSDHSRHEALMQDIAWLFLRNAHKSDQKIPGWAGFVSKLWEKPLQITTIDYYPVICNPIIQNSTV